MTPHIINFIKVPAKKPMKAPIADRKAVRVFCLFMISPIKAPTSGPTNIPIGGKNMPIIKPAAAPHVPPLVPLNCFAPQIGM